MYMHLKYVFDTFIYLKDLNRIYRIYETIYKKKISRAL